MSVLLGQYILSIAIYNIQYLRPPKMHRQPNKLSFNVSDFQKLAQAIVKEYKNTLSSKQMPNDLTKIFLAIIVAKEEQIRAQKEIRQQEMSKLFTQAFVTQDQHLKHMPQSQIDQLAGMSGKNLKIVQRLIDLKNQKAQQLKHMQAKYDQLLGMIKQLRENQNKFNLQIKNLKQENQKLLRENATLSKQNQELRKKIDRIRNEMRQFKNKHHQFKKDQLTFEKQIKTMLRNMQTIFQSKTTQMLRACYDYNNSLIALIKQTNRRNQVLSNGQATKINRQENIIKQLIQDLSQAIRFQKKQSETDEEWLKLYRELKQAKTREGNALPLRTAVYPQASLSDHDNFITKQKLFLQQFKPRP